MTQLSLTFACLDYDRTRALQDGRVKPEGIDLNFLALPVEETFFRQLRYQEFDIAEMSLSSYVLTLDQEDPPFLAIPVFPSRYFRHQSIFVNARSGIEQPADLAGRRIGVPEYQITAGVWQRGMLADEYGVDPFSPQYFSGGVETPGREEKITLDLPDGLKVQPIGPGQTLSAMLASGEIDALMSAHVPSCFGRDPDVRRLFADPKAAEKAYFAKTGIFPIMHTVVIKRAILARHPWAARSLTKAFQASLRIAKEDLAYRSALKVMLPWLDDHVAETISALGEDYWSYGVEPNRHVLEVFLRYSHAQGLAKRLRTPDELFAGSADTGYAI
ncbi:ABC transporter substrate-binding protein [Acrocarpospora macrocephala]|uniref:4,5-dihydroxyphthalate decarboxylase n=1 Tax=Acrocarpospora macrocephala TaxID=150177 RepID=A0A5M3WS58_9ACTN|nr:PhnD/SsuA/transferrin family substrate-binding protein [Acrocarpospora macrocephala]GES09018.1 4,5-dihydroxyphthalate decarboxylase [Acrocarpospora macrocephala]